MCWRPRKFSTENSVAHLVRSLRTYARIRSLTTGTFNQVVKDRIVDRLSGAYSVQSDPVWHGHSCPWRPESRTHRTAPNCPRNLSTISSAENPVNACIPQNFHEISTTGIRFRMADKEAVSSFGFQSFKIKPKIICLHARSDTRLPP
jgi:hypothetical protein